MLNSKRIISAVTIATAIALLVPSVAMAAVVDQAPVGVSGVLKFQGSTTVGPIIVGATVAFQTANPGISIADVVQNGSGDGQLAMVQHVTDIGMSSGTIKSSYPTLIDWYIARDAVCFIVNSTVTGVTQITPQQIQDIYNGVITNWNALGGPDMPIVPRARIVGSGTRSTVIDQTKALTGTGIVEASEIAVIDATGLNRLDSNVEMREAIDLPTATGQFGYVGLGFDYGTNVKTLKVVDGDLIAWSPTAINVYARKGATTNPCYPYSRFLHLCTANDWSPANAADVTTFINWIRATDGAGQASVVSTGFLKLVPDQDVKVDNSVDVLDLIQVGNAVGQTGTPRFIRADVKADGAIDVLDLIQVGNWVGVSILPS